MKKLTKGQRFALAREARRLAMECVDNGPEMDPSRYCGCALAVVIRRAGVAADDDVVATLAMELDDMLTDEVGGVGHVSHGTLERSQGNRTAVVIPLLAWADALEASNASRPKAAP